MKFNSIDLGEIPRRGQTVLVWDDTAGGRWVLGQIEWTVTAAVWHCRKFIENGEGYTGELKYRLQVFEHPIWMPLEDLEPPEVR